MAKQPFVRTANFTDISKKLQPIAQQIGAIAQNQALSSMPQFATAMSSNEQILKENPAREDMLTTLDSPVTIGKGFLAEDKRELNSDETEFALENFARLPEGVQKQLILSGQAPQQYMSKDDVESFLTTYNTTPDPDYGQSIPADRDLMNKTYGVSGTDLSKEKAGALPKPDDKKTGNPNLKKISAVNYAKQIADGLYDNQTGSEPDWGVASLLYFSKMAELASQPGATFLGAAGAAGTAPAAYLMQKEKEKAAREDKKSATIASLVPSIITAQKGKTGKMNVIQSGPAMDDAGNQKVNSKGQLLFKNIRQDASGKVIETFEAPKDDKSTNVKVDVDKKEKETFAGEIAKMSVKEFTKFRDASKAAIGNMKNVDDLLTMLANPDLNTGFKEEKFLLPLREIGNALGFDVDVSKIVNAQAFRAKTFEIVLGNVAKMKGALSDKELNFLQNMNANLGMQKDANKILLLSTRHALSKAARFNQFSLDWQNENTQNTEGEVQGIQTAIQYQTMIQDFQNDPQNNLNPLDYIDGLADKEEQQLIISMGGKLDENNQYLDNSLTSEQELDIQQQLENKYSLSLLNKVFKNYFQRGESAYKKKKKDK